MCNEWSVACLHVCVRHTHTHTLSLSLPNPFFFFFSLSLSAELRGRLARLPYLLPSGIGGQLNSLAIRGPPRKSLSLSLSLSLTQGLPCRATSGSARANMPEPGPRCCSLLVLGVVSSHDQASFRDGRAGTRFTQRSSFAPSGSMRH